MIHHFYMMVFLKHILNKYKRPSFKVLVRQSLPHSPSPPVRGNFRCPSEILQNDKVISVIPENADNGLTTYFQNLLAKFYRDL